MTAVTTTTPSDTDILGLRSVLPGSLPSGLGTPDAPGRYTVEAVFSRRPERLEIEAILGPESGQRLADAGYPQVTLTVSDRRLQIADTNLDELRNGLASVLADLLAQISEEIRLVRDARAASLHESTAREFDRAADVARLAESVKFDRTGAIDANER